MRRWWRLVAAAVVEPAPNYYAPAASAAAPAAAITRHRGAAAVDDHPEHRRWAQDRYQPLGRSADRRFGNRRLHLRAESKPSVRALRPRVDHPEQRGARA